MFKVVVVFYINFCNFYYNFDLSDCYCFFNIIIVDKSSFMRMLEGFDIVCCKFIYFLLILVFGVVVSFKF